jgi:hypothetical protein
MARIRLTENQLKKIIREAVQGALALNQERSVDLNQLKDLILKYDPESIFKDQDGYTVTTEWLVGTFSGRGFTSNSLSGALKEMCEYFNKHAQHESLVGDVVRKSGWPNLNSVAIYLESQRTEPEEDEEEGL